MAIAVEDEVFQIGRSCEPVNLGQAKQIDFRVTGPRARSLENLAYPIFYGECMGYTKHRGGEDSSQGWVMAGRLQRNVQIRYVHFTDFDLERSGQEMSLKLSKLSPELRLWLTRLSRITASFSKGKYKSPVMLGITSLISSLTLL